MRVTRPLVPADVLETWQYTSGRPDQVITVALAADGTFRQSVAAAATTTTGPQTQDGRWELRDGYVYLHGVLMKQMEGNWAPERRLDFWEVVESRQRPGQTAIYGGIYPDPDVWHEFTKVR